MKTLVKYGLRHSVLSFAILAQVLILAAVVNPAPAQVRNWAWMKGNVSQYVPGVYGTRGVPEAANTPGSRSITASSTTNTSGSFWLFGGSGYGADTSSKDLLNDLWRFNPQTNNWSWESGSTTTRAFGVYGTPGFPAPANGPGARSGSACWSDPSGNVWIFGGIGYAASGSPFFLNDLWKYDVTTQQWTWMKGSNTYNANGNYGVKGSSTASTTPGARDSMTYWSDSDGNLWLFGGVGFGATGTISNGLNDLWKYDITTNRWTWISGSNSLLAAGVYGSKGTADPANVPGARARAVVWQNSTDGFWLFGGIRPSMTYNDLWYYSYTTGLWIWVSGSDTPNQAGNYGTQGQVASSNVPGSRSSAATWTDTAGNLWLFGGTSVSGEFEDVWQFQIASHNWVWMKGSSLLNQAPHYSVPETPDPANSPGSRSPTSAWQDPSGNFWLFGGSSHNDMWKLVEPASGLNWTEYQ